VADSAPIRHVWAQTRDIAEATVTGMKRSFPIIALVAVVAIAIAVHEYRRSPGLITHGTVSRVVDGDTIHVSAGGHDQDVRIIGIDTPETVDPNRPVGCYGPQASAYVKHWLTGRRVTLVYDRVTHDVYGRSLAYVFVDGHPAVSVERRLLALGFARTLSIPPNTMHAAEYAAIEQRAALNGTGLWSACQ
jgi:micrococcal nuclease